MNLPSPNQIRRHAQKQFLRERDGLVDSTSMQLFKAPDWLRNGVSGRDRFHPMAPRPGQAGQTDSTGPWMRQGAGVMRPKRDKSKLQREKKTNAW
jgi:hypothetical protein